MSYVNPQFVGKEIFKAKDNAERTTEEFDKLYPRDEMHPYSPWFINRPLKRHPIDKSVLLHKIGLKSVALQ
jgi:hypothetical protein